MKSCPYCSNQIEDETTVCGFCSRDLTVSGSETDRDDAGEIRKGKIAKFALAALVVTLGLWWFQSEVTLPKLTATKSPPPSAPAPAPPPVPLEVRDWRWSVEKGYAVAEGEVTNVSSDPLGNVEAVVRWSSSSGAPAGAFSAPLDTRMLLAGQTSTFRLRARHRPDMERAALEFQEGGKALPWRRKAAAR
jgi:hypothetical protein